MLAGGARSFIKGKHVADVLRRAILSGELRPNERIVELHLARKLGVSQTPVREALRFLEREGLVRKVDHSGTFVSCLDDRELREVVTLRAILEGYCARLCTDTLSESQLRDLSDMIEDMSAAARAQDLKGVIEADLRFHEFLYSASDHRLLAEVLVGLHQRMRLALVLADAAYSADLEDVATSHVVVVDALASKDPDLAERVAINHALIDDSLDTSPRRQGSLSPKR